MTDNTIESVFAWMPLVSKMYQYMYIHCTWCNWTCHFVLCSGMPSVHKLAAACAGSHSGKA